MRLLPAGKLAFNNFVGKAIRKTGMLVFEAVHRRKDATIFWHIDNNFIKETHGIHKIEVTPTIGKHILLIEDEEGNVVRRRFRVLNN